MVTASSGHPATQQRHGTAESRQSTCPVCDGDRWVSRYRRLGWRFVRCRTCGLCRLEPLPTPAQLAAHYGRRSVSGNYELAKAPERTAALGDVLDFAERCGASTGSLFDVGCFDGGLLDLAGERGWEAWGLEPQEGAARSAEQKHPGRVLWGTVEDLSDPPPVSFDLITAVALIEHLRDPRRLLSLARDGLRPGGLLVIQTPDLRSLPARVLRRFWPPIAPPEHVHYFDRRTLRWISVRFGLVPVRMERHVKRLRVGYVYEQLQHFGPELHRLLGPVVRAGPRRLRDMRMPLYGGEILFAAAKASG